MEDRTNTYSADTFESATSGYDADRSTTWQSTLAAVAVGDDATATRQITGVAAGTYSTDIVNVAQLYQTYQTTVDDGMNYHGDAVAAGYTPDTDSDDNEFVHRDLGETINIVTTTNGSEIVDRQVEGGKFTQEKGHEKGASGRNLQAVMNDGAIELEMTNTPDFNTVTIGKYVANGNTYEKNTNEYVTIENVNNGDNSTNTMNVGGDTGITIKNTKEGDTIINEIRGVTYQTINYGDVDASTERDAYPETIVNNRVATEGQIADTHYDLLNRGANYAGNEHIDPVQDTPLTWTDADGNEHSIPVTDRTDSIHQNLGGHIDIVGGAGRENAEVAAKLTTDVTNPDLYSVRNLRTVTDGETNAMYLQMSERPHFTERITIGSDPTNPESGNNIIIDGAERTINNLDYNNRPVTRNSYEPGRILTEDQLANSHFTVSAGGNDSGVYPGDTLSFSGDRNIHVNNRGNEISITLDPDLVLRSVTTGNTFVDTRGLRINQGNGPFGRGPSVTTEGIDAAGMRITGVADGVNPWDAINRGQLDALDHRISDRIDDLDDSASAGVASAMAAANVPQATEPGANLLGVGLGYYNDQPAAAIGYSAMNDSGRWLFKGSLSANSEEVTVGSGVSYQW